MAIPDVQARQFCLLSAAVLVRVFIFLFFHLIFAPKTSLNVPSLCKMLSLILKTTCKVSLETFVNFLLVYRSFHFERCHHRDLHDF